MSNIDKQAIRDAAKEVIAEGGTAWFDEGQLSDKTGLDIPFTDAAFIASASPETVLALLDELEAKDKQIDDLKATAAHSNAGWKEAHEQEARAEAAEKRIAELERKEQLSERQSVIDELASSGEAWSDIEEYMQKWDAERAAAAGKGE